MDQRAETLQVSSDQSVPLSERVTTAKRKVRKELEKVGLARVAGDLEKLMQVSVRVKATVVSESKMRLGSSKLGGLPDLPPGVAWPECDGVPMALLAQFRLQDIVPYDLDGRLPKAGMLYFFYQAEAQRPGNPEDRGHWQVIYYAGEFGRLRHATWPVDLPKRSRFRSCKVTFSNEITLPPWGSEEIERLKLSNKEDHGYDFPYAGKRGEAVHRMLGYPGQVQVHDMPLECECASNGLRIGDLNGKNDPRRPALEKRASDWRLLLQIDSDENNLGTIWGDAGRVYFWIREQDLKRRDFSKVWLIMQCL